MIPCCGMPRCWGQAPPTPRWAAISRTWLPANPLVLARGACRTMNHTLTLNHFSIFQHISFKTWLFSCCLDRRQCNKLFNVMYFTCQRFSCYGWLDVMCMMWPHGVSALCSFLISGSTACTGETHGFSGLHLHKRPETASRPRTVCAHYGHSYWVQIAEPYWSITHTHQDIELHSVWSYILPVINVYLHNEGRMILDVSAKTYFVFVFRTNTHSLLDFHWDLQLITWFWRTRTSLGRWNKYIHRFLFLFLQVEEI